MTRPVSGGAFLRTGEWAEVRGVSWGQEQRWVECGGGLAISRPGAVHLLEGPGRYSLSLLGDTWAPFPQVPFTVKAELRAVGGGHSSSLKPRPSGRTDQVQISSLRASISRLPSRGAGCSPHTWNLFLRRRPGAAAATALGAATCLTQRFCSLCEFHRYLTAPSSRLNMNSCSCTKAVCVSTQ